jgi:hypothetical protein
MEPVLYTENMEPNLIGACYCGVRPFPKNIHHQREEIKIAAAPETFSQNSQRSEDDEKR